MRLGGLKRSLEKTASTALSRRLMQGALSPEVERVARAYAKSDSTILAGLQRANAAMKKKQGVVYLPGRRAQAGTAKMYLPARLRAALHGRSTRLDAWLATPVITPGREKAVVVAAKTGKVPTKSDMDLVNALTAFHEHREVAAAKKHGWSRYHPIRFNTGHVHPSVLREEAGVVARLDPNGVARKEIEFTRGASGEDAMFGDVNGRRGYPYLDNRRGNKATDVRMDNFSVQAPMLAAQRASRVKELVAQNLDAAYKSRSGGV